MTHRLRDLVEIRVPQPPVVEDQGQAQWQRNVADSLNAFPNFSVFSFVTPESNVTAAFGTVGINITESVTSARVWIKDSGLQNTGWKTVTEATAGAAHVVATTTALGPEHTVTGLTSGQVLRADGASAASFTQLAFSDLSGSIANGQVPQGAVTQHQAALSIAASQITAGTFGTGSYTFDTNLTIAAALLALTGEFTGGLQSYIDAAGNTNFIGGLGAGGALSSGGTSNVLIGNATGDGVTTGDNNIAFGLNALGGLTVGSQNIAIGQSSMLAATVTTGTFQNVCVGVSAGSNINGGNNNLVFGTSAGIRITSTDLNVMFGPQTGFGVATGSIGTRNIFLGYRAGWDETGNDTLIIDNADRGSEALGRTDALIYGVMNATAANQTLALNATVTVAQDFKLGLAVSQIVPGATSLSLRNNADNADNLILTDAGAATFRSTVGGITTLTATTLAGTLSTAAQPNVTSIGTLAANLLFVDNSHDIGASGATRPRALFLAGTATAAALVTTSTTGPQFGDAAGAAAMNMVVQAAAGQERGFQFNTGTSRRWRFFADAAAETGSDAGSTFTLIAYDDSAVLIDIPLGIVRAAGGQITFSPTRLMSMGEISAREATFALSQNTDTNIFLNNVNGGTGAQANIYVTNAASAGSGMFMGVGGTAFTTAGGFTQDAGWIGTGSLLGGGLAIMTRSSSSIRFYTAGHTNLRWEIDSSGHLLAGTDNTFDIGASGATRARDFFLARNAAIGNDASVAGRLTLSTVTTLADDATPTVAASNLFKSGGTTAITDLDDGVVGQTIKILAAHSITITDGAPIILSGGANFDMVATDTLELTMFDDQVWQEVSRSVN